LTLSGYSKSAYPDILKKKKIAFNNRKMRMLGIYIFFIFMNLQTSPTLPPSTTTEHCPPGWEEFETHCYWFSGNSTLSWPNADADCIQRGGHLASVHSKAEQEFIFSISARYTWLGASDIVLEVGHFSYTFSFYF
jgi:hypothetical protein